MHHSASMQVYLIKYPHNISFCCGYIFRSYWITWLIFIKNFHNWLHWKLSKWHFTVQPVMLFQNYHISVSGIIWHISGLWWIPSPLGNYEVSWYGFCVMTGKFSAHGRPICRWFITHQHLMFTRYCKMPDHFFNSLGPSDAIWRQRSGSTLAQVMACCLTAPSHYLNQCWLVISGVHWDSSEGNFRKDTSALSHYIKMSLKIAYINFFYKSPSGQWVNWILL